MTATEYPVTREEYVSGALPEVSRERRRTRDLKLGAQATIYGLGALMMGAGYQRDEIPTTINTAQIMGTCPAESIRHALPAAMLTTAATWLYNRRQTTETGFLTRTFTRLSSNRQKLGAVALGFIPSLGYEVMHNQVGGHAFGVADLAVAAGTGTAIACLSGSSEVLVAETEVTPTPEPVS